MNPPITPSLQCRGLTVRVPGRTLVQDLELDLVGGEVLAILGQNGAGKSMTLHTMAGVRAASSGETLLCGQLLSDMPRRSIAKILALLPQDTEDIFPATVMDTVMIGRHPHIPRFQWHSAADTEIALRCLDAMDIVGLSYRDVNTLSGGERRRLAIAQILTQQPDIYLLDEPTNHLDPQHQLDVLRVLGEKAKSGSVVVASLHDVNLAARYADHCLLLFGDGRWKLGPTETVLNETELSELYATPMEAVRWRDKQLFVAVDTR